MPQLTKILIANRGEIAVRVARACRDHGLASVAVYSDPDADALHVAVADEAFHLPGTSSAETYLDMDALIDVARRAGADGVHPGYGFLSENADFAQKVMDAGLTWIGPTPQAICDLGDKITARAIAQRAGAPLVPGSDGPVESPAEARAFAEEHGLPIAIKAAFGGGGRGIKVVRELDDVEDAFASATREAVTAFGRGECFVERFLDRPRHVEAQVLADTHGTVVVVGTRDCSLQRRNQKLVEEAPAPFLTDEQRTRIHESARRICAEAGYTGAGTVEYLVAPDGLISFLEVNTRLQVEHPVTEETTGVDLVGEQFRIAAGERLSLTEDPRPRGHALEFRLNAEDPAMGFLPSPGPVEVFESPTGPGIRVDSGVRSGSVVPGHYDSLMAKLIVWGADRPQAIARAKDALAELRIEGLPSVLPFHRAVLDDEDFTRADRMGVYTTWIESAFAAELESSPYLGAAAPENTRTQMTVDIDGRAVRLGLPSAVHAALLGGGGSRGRAALAAAPAAEDAGAVTAPITGSLVAWKADDGAQVAAGDVVAVMEAMKMETTVKAPSAGVFRRESLEPGTALTRGQRLGVVGG
ncbi:ATP-grasp domain-containing protein [Micrococcus sp. EYE_162]|uniref:acetyl/propionyl/methylcrotonyl-CoA carboxylase subunit alpha n=1 Tax=unclassified Micrococcus TaxID=2620948 RepID=UPI002003D552|nr:MULTISPECIES: biotin carboxylase N-terminal domain-containing protein [unclassified Micrococcus]MCK6095312.1 ATP-grasp domain-containing protein [Micrococcus sp. EYE_212]MCK6171416.1 ATP-grasp domain-containing protein [Micrococcus sp. EYE_162]